VRLLERGVDLLPADDPRRLEVLPELAYALARRGELERAQEILRSAIDEARRVGNEGVEAYARLDLLRIRTRVDPASKVEDELSEALEIAAALEPTDDLANLSRAHREIGMARFMLGRAGEGEADLEQSAAFAHRAGDSGLERAALVARLRPVAWGPTPAGAGIAICDLLLSDEVANVANKSLAFHVRSLLLAMRGDFAAASVSAADARALIEEFGLTLSGGIYSMDVGFALVLAGDLEQAEYELRRGHDLLAGVGDTGADAQLTRCSPMFSGARVVSMRPSGSQRRAVRSPLPTTSTRSRGGALRSLGSSRGRARTTRRCSTLSTPSPSSSRSTSSR
jgi:tetratricopeptide (TPR) repeat protein